MNKIDYVLAEDPAVDLAVAQAMTAELNDYLFKEDLYRQMLVHTPAGDQRPQMTGGDLLTRLYRLHGEGDLLTVEQRRALDQVQGQVEQVTQELHARFHERLLREVRARLNSLRWFLDDCRQDRTRGRTEYPYEIRNRQRIEEILKALPDPLPTELADALQQIDRQIENMTNATDFIWENRLESIFPRKVYWYLYRRPPG